MAKDKKELDKIMFLLDLFDYKLEDIAHRFDYKGNKAHLSLGNNEINIDIDNDTTKGAASLHDIIDAIADDLESNLSTYEIEELLGEGPRNINQKIRNILRIHYDSRTSNETKN